MMDHIIVDYLCHHLNSSLPDPDCGERHVYRVLFGIMDTACVFGIANGFLLLSVGDAAGFVRSFKVNL